MNSIDKSKSKLKENSDKFWYDDPNILFSVNRIKNFFPSSNMSFEEQLNSYTRLSFYIAFIMYAYTGKYHFLFIFIITIILTFLIYNNNNNKVLIGKEIEKFGNDYYPADYVYPTKDNPFMNITMEDYRKNPNRQAITKTHNFDKKILNQIESKFNLNLYKDLDDIFEKKNSQRQFYTTPITTIPNDQTKYANWLYKIDKTCKEGDGTQCNQNNYNPTYLGIIYSEL